MTPAQAKRINAQLRRLRAGLEAARETMAIHFGEDDEAVRRADRALNPPTELTLVDFAETVGGQPLRPWQRDILNHMEANPTAQIPTMRPRGKSIFLKG